MQVGVHLFHSLAVCLLHLVLRMVAIDAHHFVIIYKCHFFPPILYYYRLMCCFLKVFHNKEDANRLEYDIFFLLL